MSAQPKIRFSPAEYAALEEKAEYKSQYYDGEIFAMAGGTYEHSALAGNVFGRLFSRLDGKPCQPYNSDLMVSILETGLRTYPDVSVVCGQREMDPEVKVAVTNPTVLVEVLSPSTEAYDRGTKAEHYRKIPSLKCLILVASTRRHVEVYERREDGAWVLREYSGAGQSVPVASLGLELAMEEIYRGVELPEGGSALPAPVAAADALVHLLKRPVE